MGNINSVKIFSLHEYLDAIAKITNDWNVESLAMPIFYRGQGNADWQLIPKLYRIQFIKNYEREMIRDFKCRSRSVNGFILPSVEFEWLSIMQHYGIPTRLLDWTEDHLIALFFAIYELEDVDAAVWVLHPWSLNKHTIGRKSVPTCDDDIFTHSYLLDSKQSINAIYPAALRPTYNSNRITAQKGFFTIHGNDNNGLDSIISNYSDEKILHKIVINRQSKKKLLQDLYKAGKTFFNA